jgi:acetoin utilization protein AcuB
MQWLEPILVRDWMHRDPVVVRADAPIVVAADLLRTRKIRHLPVVDGRGRLVGIVTDRDLRQVIFDPWIQDALGDATLTLRALIVREVMTWGVLSVRADADLRAAARLIRERKIGALPVVDDGRLVGLLTESDVLAASEKLLGTRLATIRPLVGAPGIGEPYDYGFPIPEGQANQGVID